MVAHEGEEDIRRGINGIFGYPLPNYDDVSLSTTLYRQQTECAVGSLDKWESRFSTTFDGYPGRGSGGFRDGWCQNQAVRILREETSDGWASPIVDVMGTHADAARFPCADQDLVSKVFAQALSVLKMLTPRCMICIPITLPIA
nr:hypothetical protein Iba_chr03bCG5140 [Ipomoea batatas]